MPWVCLRRHSTTQSRSPTGCPKVPEVGHVLTLATFVPDQQQEKLQAHPGCAHKTAPHRSIRRSAWPPPTDEENIEALKEVVNQLGEVAKDRNGVGVAAVKRLQAADHPACRCQGRGSQARPTQVLVAAAAGLPSRGLKASLRRPPITRANLPPELVSDWVTPDGTARASKRRRKPIPPTMRRCASSPAPCWRSSRMRSKGRSRFLKRATRSSTLSSGRHLGAVVDRHPAVDRPATIWRCAAHADPAADRRHGDAGGCAC